MFDFEMKFKLVVTIIIVIFVSYHIKKYIKNNKY